MYSLLAQIFSSLIDGKSCSLLWQPFCLMNEKALESVEKFFASDSRNENEMNEMYVRIVGDMSRMAE